MASTATGTGRVAANYTSYLGAWTYVTLVSTGSAKHLSGDLSQRSRRRIGLEQRVFHGDRGPDRGCISLRQPIWPALSKRQHGRVQDLQCRALCVLDSGRIQQPDQSLHFLHRFILRVFRQQSNPAGGMRLLLRNSPCSVNSSTVTIPVAATQAGSALIMTYGGGSTTNANDIQRILHGLHLGPGSLLQPNTRCGSLLRPQRPGRNDHADCSSEQHQRLVVQRQRVVLAAIVGDRDR